MVVIFPVGMELGCLPLQTTEQAMQRVYASVHENERVYAVVLGQSLTNGFYEG